MTSSQLPGRPAAPRGTSLAQGPAELSLAEVMTFAGGGLAALLEPAGAILLRDADVHSAAALERLAARLGLAALPQLEPFAPRRKLGPGAWSHPVWPNTAPMCMHHELGWQRQPPPYLLVACLRPAASGGHTGVADGRAVLARLPDRLVDKAARCGWTLVRRYSAGLIGMPWETAFPDMDTAAIEAYAATEGIRLEWDGPERLITWRDRPAISPTGSTGTPAWANLLAFCSEWTMDQPVREYLLSVLGREALPFETSFGDRSPFTAADLETVNATYDQVTTYVRWQPGCVLLLDNIRVAHSMTPFTGNRQMTVVHAAEAAAASLASGG